MQGGQRGEGGFGTRPWWLALFGGAYWPLAVEPSATTSRPPHYCGHPHCCTAGGARGRGGVLAQGLGIRLFAFGSAYWPLATAHSDPLWARTCFGCGGGGERKYQKGGGSRTKKLCTQKWPDRIVPTVNFVFPAMVTLVWGHGGRGGGYPLLLR